MLLLHDSLGYTSTAHFQGAGYIVVAGAPVYGLPHERPSATSIGQVGFQTPVVGPGTSPVCITGVLMWVVPTLYETTTFFEIGGSAGTQVRVVMEKAASGWRLLVYRGSSIDLLLVTPFVSMAGWVFLEMKAVLSATTGSFVIRLDGTEVARVEGANTLQHPGTLWDRVRLFCYTSITVRFADLYLCDGRTDQGPQFASFLGKSTHSKLLLGEPAKIDWSPIPVLPGKARLCILAGQSNMTGRTTSVVSSKWTNPNPRVLIWNRLAGVPAFQPLSATVNSACAFLPANVPVAGPEMRFAERLSAHFAASGDSSTPNIYIVKGAQDGSFVFPVTPDYSWDPDVVGGLYSRMISQISAAVAALGGWSQIGSVDLFWLQGESDCIYTVSASAYEGGLRHMLGSMIADIAANGPSVATHVIRIHKDLYQGTAPDSIGFYYKERIRYIHDRIGDLLASDLEPLGWDLRFRKIDLDSCEISGDLTHLTEAGYDRLGDLMFESWLGTQNYNGLLSDYETLPDVDSLWLGVSSTGKSCLFQPAGAADSTNSRVFAVSARHHSSAAVAGLPWSSVAAGVTLFESAHLSPAAPWQRVFATSPVDALPESLSLNVGLTT